MFELDAGQLLKLLLLNTVQQKTDMTEVLRRMRTERPNWMDLRQMILDISSVNTLTPEYMANGGRGPQANVVQSPKKNKGPCDKCGKENHNTDQCRIPEKDLKCDFHNSVGSHNTAACQAKKRGSRPPTPTATGARPPRRSRSRSRTRSPRREIGRNTPRRELSPLEFQANVVCFLLREEREDLYEGDSDDEGDNAFATPPQSPVNPEVDRPQMVTDSDIEDCLVTDEEDYNPNQGELTEDEDDDDCPGLMYDVSENEGLRSQRSVSEPLLSQVCMESVWGLPILRGET